MNFYCRMGTPTTKRICTRWIFRGAGYKFKDQVLFLKHNLNAQAIASLKSELVSVEGNIESLIKELNASIKEADSFIASMTKDNA